MQRRPPYFDPISGLRYDTSAGNKEGWLMKQSEWLKDWRRRYFILKDNKLFFSKSQWCAPHGMIDLSQCQTVKSAEHKAGKKYAIEISTREITYFLHGMNDKEKDEWIGVLGRAIVHSSRSLLKDEDMTNENDYDSDDNDHDENSPYYYR